MWIVELLVVLLFIWFGARLGSIGIGYAGGFGVLVLSLVFGLKPGDIPFDVILIIMGVISAHCRNAGGRRPGLPGASRCTSLEKRPQIHHLPGPGSHLLDDHFCRNWPYRLSRLARYCRGCQKGGDTSIKAACHWNGRVADCHHRFPHIRGGYLLCIRARTIRGRLCQTPAHHHSQYFHCMHAWRNRRQFHGQRTEG